VKLPGKRPVFLDTSVLFAAIFSVQGGSRALFQLGELGAIDLWVGSRVLQEADAVVSGKFPHTRPLLAEFLALAKVQVGPQPDETILENARLWISYLPDAYVLAEATAAKAEYLVTLDRTHFLDNQVLRKNIPFKIGTSGDCLAWLRDVLR
jgi:predicted nucleic acid-binding protein